MQDQVEEKVQLAKSRGRGEEGQSIVLIALMIVGIIAFVGLATDAGFLFARSSQWSAAVDAAALAGAPDLSIGEAEAEIRAEQFLAANGWEFDQAQSYGKAVTSELGVPEFAFTATLPVQTFFLRIIGFQDEIDMTRSATAAYYSLTDMPLPTQEDRGRIREASQFIFGQNTCTDEGDPVSPRLSAPGVGNEFHGITDGIYQYRILVPGDYPSNVGPDVRIQLFDPDPHNNVLAGDTVTTIDPTTGDFESEFMECPLAPLEFSKSCIIRTDDPVENNPIWLVRVDEIYEDDPCGGQKSTEPSSNTITTWRLYFEDTGGEEHTIATYNSNAAPFAATDLKWVTPGLTPSVPTEDGGSFHVDITDPLGDGSMTIPPDEFGNYSIFLEVTAETGTSQNTWDIWAGPPSVADDANVDEDGDGEINANDRNLYLLQNYPLAGTRDVRVYAVGRMPVSTLRSDVIHLPVASVEDSEAGLDLYVSVFDLDGGAAGDPDFGGDLHYRFDIFGESYPVDWNYAPTCDGFPNCNNRWRLPQMTIDIPANTDPDAPPTVSFFGGNLVVDYTAGRDEHVWSTLITRGSAFLTE